MNELATASTFLRLGFIGLAVVVLVGVIWAVKERNTRIALAAWIILVSVIASTEILASFWPPRLMVVIVPTFAGAIYVARKSKHLVALPLWLLVGVQGFRVLVEILIHQAVTEDISPPQLSWYPGLNYDVLSGISALILVPFAGKIPSKILVIWNTLALGLLAWVVIVAVLSFPTPFQVFTPSNHWVAYFPYVLLPVVMVSAALLCHITIYRKLLGAEL